MYTFQLVLVLLSIGLNRIQCEPLNRLDRSICFCGANECCSKWGFCGVGEDYCGKNCRSGACYNSKSLSQTPIITFDIFSCVFSKIDTDLRSKRFNGLIDAMKYMKWQPINQVEAAIFLAHVSHETDGLKTLVEYCSISGSCNNYQSSWCSIQAHPKVQYYGRGLFQLSYPCNYYQAGQALGLDLLKDPDLVSSDDTIAAATAIWYYKETGMNECAQKGDFGSSTRKLNEYECQGKAGYSLQLGRIETYQRVRQCFNLPVTTQQLSC